ncbi:hypothetical protein ANCDUO_21424, partial [Ancylostoma duodenale]
MTSLTTTGHDINNWEHFVYIGLRMDKRTGKWYWTDGSKVDFTKWAKYQPDQPKTEHCAQLYQDLGPKLWTNIEGSRRAGSLGKSGGPGQPGNPGIDGRGSLDK